MTPALYSTKKPGDTCFRSRGGFPKTDPSLFILLKPPATPEAGWARMLTFPPHRRTWSNLEEGKIHALFLDQGFIRDLEQLFQLCASRARLQNEIMAPTHLSHVDAQKYPERLDKRRQYLQMGKLPVTGFCWSPCQIQEQRDSSCLHLVHSEE